MLVLFLVMGDAFLMRTAQEDSLDRLFQGAVMAYREKNYRQVLQDLNMLISLLQEGGDSQGENNAFLGKVYLLLGAANEQMNRPGEAKKYYLLAAQQPHIPEIEGVEIILLPGYRQVFSSINPTPEPQVIERPSEKPKKKGLSLLTVLIGATVLAGLTTLVLTNIKKKNEELGVDPNFDVNVVNIQWAYIPAGEFMMGDNFNEGDADEQQVHAVYLDEYYISRYEITFTQYEVFAHETNSTIPNDQGWGREMRPVINITWAQANHFCEWLSERTGKYISLPSEAQWEKAARGTDQRRYPWGNDDPTCLLANYNCDNITHSGALHPTGISPYGVYNMAGNVSEWCLDIYLSDYYSMAPYRNPILLQNPDLNYGYHVIRGGSWDITHTPSIRSADRGHGFYSTSLGIQNHRSTDLGFRIIWSPQTPARQKK